MTLKQFRSLTHPEQDEEVFDNGVHLISYHQDDLMYDVYKLHHFFVEFSYNLTENEPPEIKAFSATEDFHLFENHLSQVIGIS